MHAHTQPKNSWWRNLFGGKGKLPIRHKHFQLELAAHWRRDTPAKDVENAYSANVDDNIIHCYNTENPGETLRIIYTRSPASLEESERALGEAMQATAHNQGHEITQHLNPFITQPSLGLELHCKSFTDDSFGNQYGIIGDQQVVFVVHTGEFTTDETVNAIKTSLAEIIWLG